MLDLRTISLYQNGPAALQNLFQLPQRTKLRIPYSKNSSASWPQKRAASKYSSRDARWCGAWWRPPQAVGIELGFARRGQVKTPARAISGFAPRVDERGPLRDPSRCFLLVCLRADNAMLPFQLFLMSGRIDGARFSGV